MSTLLTYIAAAPGGGASRTFNSVQGTDVTADPIVCSKIQHGIDLPIVTSNTGRTTGASLHGSIRLTHGIDKASPKLRELCATKKDLGEVHIVRIGAGGVATGAGDVEMFRLGSAKIGSVALETGSSGDGPNNTPVEVFTLDYTEITWDWKENNSWSQKGWSVDGLKKIDSISLPAGDGD